MWRAGLMLATGCSLVAQASPLSPSPSSTASAPAVAEPAREVDPPIDSDATYMPILTSPADPWTGVAGDQPKTFGKASTELSSPERWYVRDEKIDCTAARDHCLPAIAWILIEKPSSDPVHEAAAVAFRPDGPVSPYFARVKLHTNINFLAYRTVPATHKNLVPGVIATAVDFPAAYPARPIDAFSTWYVGAVDHVDWDMGFVYLVGREAPLFITAARVAVLSYTPGGKVKILGDKKRDELAVSAKDIILPAP